MSLLTELKRRNVFRVAVAYTVIAWVLAQVADLAFDNFGTPEWVGKTVLFILVLGFPLAVFFAWAYELTPEGIKRESEVDRSRSITQVTAHKLDRAIIAVLMVALAYFAYDKIILSSTQEGKAVQITVPATAGHVSVEPELAAESNPSIAVLPFANMSDDAANEYFSDGLSEEILNLLAKVPGLKVIARTSSYAFKGKNQDLREVGEALGVRHVLEGSVRKSGERIRITAQLIDVSDGSHIWPDTFDRTMTDIFQIQDKVAGAIVDTLRIHVVDDPDRGRPTESTQAYELFLQARAGNSSPSDTIKYLQAAVALDPGFAEAWELLAVSHWTMAGTEVKSNEGQRLTFEAASRALELDPDVALARALQRSADLEAYTWLGEIQAFEEVLREQPGNTDALDALAFDLIEAGYVQEAIPYAERLYRLDPLSNFSKIRYYQALVAADRQDDAMALLAGDVTTSDDFRMLQADLLLFEGQVDQVIYWYERMWKNFFANVTWVKSVVENGRDPEGGQEYLDAAIAEQLSTLPEDQRFEAGQSKQPLS